MELFKIHFNKPDNSKTVVKYYRITPYHVSSGGQESKTINSVKLMSRRENKKIGQNQPIEHGQNHAKNTAYRICKRSTAPEHIKIMPGM